MTNYICINGKKAELTEEQMKLLGIKANPFVRTDLRKPYYVIDTYSGVSQCTEANDPLDERAFNNGNYCTDKAIMEQRLLHEILYRLLWRYSMEHDGDKIDWSNGSQNKFEIDFTHYREEDCFEVTAYSITQNICSVYFASEETAFDAIEEIIKPFMTANPEFKF